MNMLTIPEDWKYIGLRQTPEEALRRLGQVGEVANKDTHVMLAVTFSPLGVAHFCSTFGDQSYKFMLMLSKMFHWYADDDHGVWHFIRNLPLSMNDEIGNELVSSEWKEIA